MHQVPSAWADTHDKSLGKPKTCHAQLIRAKLARWAGLEPTTVGLENRCSIQLSYHRMLFYYNEIQLI